LGFFDPEAINPAFKNVDAGAGTVDIEYQLSKRLESNRTPRRLWWWWFHRYFRGCPSTFLQEISLTRSLQTLTYGW
jgi:hypothetical protein